MATATLKSTIVDIQSGEISQYVLTAEEIAEREASATSLAELEAKATARASALAKLAELGLTADEIAAL